MTQQNTAGGSLLNAFLKLVVFVLILVVFSVFVLTAMFFLDIPVDGLFQEVANLFGA